MTSGNAVTLGISNDHEADDEDNSTNVPITSEFYFGKTFTFFVDFDILGAARTAVTVLVVDFDLFLFLTTSARQGGGEGRVASFVTFPSDALGVDLAFYSGTSSGRLFGNVAPVRRWEDAERNRNSGVKVQVDCGEGERARLGLTYLSDLLW